MNALYYTYGYDNNQNITALTDHINSAFSLTSLSYDGLDRLTNTAGGSGIGSSTIAYDGLGNITSYQSKGRNLTYTYNYTANAATYGDSGVNRLRSVSDSVGTKDYAFFSYDDRGNITNTSFNGLTFNRANQVTNATTTTGSSNSFVYDGHNRRVKKTSSKGIEYSFYGQDGTLLYRENQADGGGINYIYLGKKLIAKDGFIPENSGKQHYRPYGESIEGAPDDVGYTGHKFDKDLGLSYMQARYYDPVIGRFYSNDPVDVMGHIERGNMVQGFGRYTYVNNNPYKYTDPDGEFLLQAAGAIGGALLGVAAQAVADITSGSAPTLGKYLGASAGGAVAGVIATTTFNPGAATAAGLALKGAVAGGVGGATGNAIQQKVDTGSIGLGEVAKNSLTGATIGAVVPGVKMPGITSGQGSFTAVAKTANTKLANGTISNVSNKTAAKAVAADVVQGAGQAATSSAALATCQSNDDAC